MNTVPTRTHKCGQLVGPLLTKIVLTTPHTTIPLISLNKQQSTLYTHSKSAKFWPTHKTLSIKRAPTQDSLEFESVEPIFQLFLTSITSFVVLSVQRCGLPTTPFSIWLRKTLEGTKILANSVVFTLLQIYFANTFKAFGLCCNSTILLIETLSPWNRCS